MSYFIQILGGLEVTLRVFCVSLLLSLPLGIVVALCRLSKIKAISYFTQGYIWVLRGTPLLLQIIFVYFGLPSKGIRFEKMDAIYFAFVLNYAAYFGEIFRSGIQSIERGQSEAAEILGFTPWQIQLKIILPQVVKRTFPAVGNEIITLIKDTSFVYIVGMGEIIKAAKEIANRDATLVPYVIAGAIFLVLTFVLTNIFTAVEKKINYNE